MCGGMKGCRRIGYYEGKTMLQCWNISVFFLLYNTHFIIIDNYREDLYLTHKLEDQTITQNYKNYITISVNYQ